MAAQVIPASYLPSGLLISINYDGTGKAWAQLFDNPVLGWTADDTGVAEPKPIIIGALPPAAPATAPILSPQWAVYFPTNVVLVPDVYRGNAYDFFTWLATNNGATRQLKKGLAISYALFNEFDSWARAHPTMIAP